MNNMWSTRLSLRTQAEQARGRGLVAMSTMLSELVDRKRALCIKVGVSEHKIAVYPCTISSDPEKFSIECNVFTWSGNEATFRETFAAFPSDTLITQIMLVL